MKNLKKMKTRFLTLLSLVIITSAQAQVGGWDPEAIEKAEKAINEFKVKDTDLQKFFDQAYGYVVFPSIGKGAIVFGGAHGRGIVFEQGEPIGNAKITQISWGLQLGGQSYREVIFFETEKALESFKESDFEFAAQVSAVAAAAGASADAAYENGVTVFTMTKGGLMYEASIGGQKFKYFPEDQSE